MCCTCYAGGWPPAIGFELRPQPLRLPQVLYVTNPEDWSPAATREATRLFASNLNSRMAQRFYNLVLLPNVQDNIKQHGRLNFHLYLALKKSLFKPAAFFKGVLLPLCEQGATLREAVILSSLLSKVPARPALSPLRTLVPPTFPLLSLSSPDSSRRFLCRCFTLLSPS